MIDSLGKEICDMLQVVAYDMPRGAADAPLVEIGMGTLDQNKGFSSPMAITWQQAPRP